MARFVVPFLCRMTNVYSLSWHAVNYTNKRDEQKLNLKFELVEYIENSPATIEKLMATISFHSLLKSLVKYHQQTEDGGDIIKIQILSS